MGLSKLVFHHSFLISSILNGKIVVYVYYSKKKALGCDISVLKLNPSFFSMVCSCLIVIKSLCIVFTDIFLFVANSLIFLIFCNIYLSVCLLNAHK